VEGYLPPRRSRGHVWAVIQRVYEATSNHRGTNLADALGFVHRMQRRRCVIVVVSDFLDSGEWLPVLGALASRHKVHAVAVHDPLDDGLSGLGLMELVDAETGHTRVVDTASWMARQSLDQRVQQIRRTGARTVSMSTTDDPFVLLHRHFQREGARR
jgi:uncharacterized protein (DUF58 family)